MTSRWFLFDLWFLFAFWREPHSDSDLTSIYKSHWYILLYIQICITHSNVTLCIHAFTSSSAINCSFCFAFLRFCFFAVVLAARQIERSSSTSSISTFLHLLLYEVNLITTCLEVIKKSSHSHFFCFWWLFYFLGILNKISPIQSHE